MSIAGFINNRPANPLIQPRADHRRGQIEAAAFINSALPQDLTEEELDFLRASLPPQFQLTIEDDRAERRRIRKLSKMVTYNAIALALLLLCWSWILLCECDNRFHLRRRLRVHVARWLRSCRDGLLEASLTRVLLCIIWEISAGIMDGWKRVLGLHVNQFI